VVGGVEGVIQAHTWAFDQAHYPVTVISGRGEAASLAPGTSFVSIPEVDSQHPQIERISAALEKGRVPSDFDDITDRLVRILKPALEPFDNVIVHNILTKRYNLPLTAALHALMDDGTIRHAIAWCHDIGWTSPNSRPKLHGGQPWDLLRTQRKDLTYVVVSKHRQAALASLFGCAREAVHVVYNGVDAKRLLGLSEEGAMLIERLGLLESDLVLLMPVRVAVIKNIEYALRVVAALKAQGCCPKLVLTGPPDYHDPQSMAYFDRLRAMRNKLELTEEVHFVFESGPDPDRPYVVDMHVVGDLFRVSDAMFMPSHREGFGMPVLEAGLAGIPVVCTKIPAAEEIGGDDVILFDTGQDPAQVAARIRDCLDAHIAQRFRRRVRQGYTWQAIFRRDIQPLLDAGAAV
jgi:glycosyltransferase involved in cell wall biosynthesis